GPRGALHQGRRQGGRHRRRLLPHRPAGHGHALRRADSRAQGAALRRLVPGLVAAHRLPGRQPCGEEVKPYSDPYVAGAGPGLVLLASCVLAGRGLGASGAFTSVAASVADSPVFHKSEWLLLEIAGVVIGGFLSALLAGRVKLAIERGPRMARAPRLALALRGGAGMGAGAGPARRWQRRPGLDRRRVVRVGGWGVAGAGVRRRVRARAAAAGGMAMMTALLIGIAFGWCLERAGLGDARKLTGQFYLTDLTVFKVMFSAIVTAMLGAFWLARLGVLDLRGV